MASFCPYKCRCGIILDGSVAIKHILRCKSRAAESPLAKACAAFMDKAALLYELLAEVQSCSNSRLSSQEIEPILSQVLAEAPLQRRNEPLPAENAQEYMECAECSEPTSLVLLKFECGHVFCQNHLKPLYGKSQARCPKCMNPLLPTEMESIGSICCAFMEEEKDFTCDDTCRCSACNRPSDMSELVFLDCLHSVCAVHIREAFLSEYGRSNKVGCPVKGCTYTLCRAELESVVSKAEMDRVEEENTMALLNSASGKMVICCKCQWKGSLERGSIDLNYRNEKGEVISEEAAIHMAEFRLRCPACRESSCVSCGCSPYHEGLTCEQRREQMSAKHCRYCQNVVAAGVECCQGQDCQDRLSSACKKTLPCGHPCCGVDGEETCLPCLQDDCQSGEPIGHDLCVICYCEELLSAPSVRLLCGHALHYHCLSTSLEKRWNGPRITFKFAKCPSCNDWAKTPHIPVLAEKLTKYQDLHAQIVEKALKRLQFEGEDKLPRLSDPSDNYFQQPEKYAMDRFCYYECFKCKQPYFGGKKDCQQRDEDKAFNPEELVCAKCAASQIEGAAECSTHGSDYIQFKCRFCCAFAVWFCWGTTHFCEPCHQLQVNGGNPAGKPKDQLPQCPGQTECPLKVDHPANGEEFGMGCAMCRDLRANLSDF